MAERIRALGGLLVVALLATALTACGGGTDKPVVSGVRTNNHGYHGAYLDQPYHPAKVSLRDTAGDPVDLASPTARLRLVFFGYTNCPDVCQVVMSTMASAILHLPKGDRGKVQGVFVTTDPGRDTPSALRSYLDRFDPSFVGLTGSLPQIIAAGKPLGIFVEKGQKLPSGGYEVNHTAVTVAIVDGVGRLVWTNGTSPAEMAHDLEKLLEETA